MTDMSDFINQLNSIISNTSDTSNTSNTSVNASVTTTVTTSNASVTTSVVPVASNVSVVPVIQKTKILIVSTHINQSNGYSKVIYNIIKELSKLQWITLVHFGTQPLSVGNIGRIYI